MHLYQTPSIWRGCAVESLPGDTITSLIKNRFCCVCGGGLYWCFMNLIMLRMPSPRPEWWIYKWGMSWVLTENVSPPVVIIKLSSVTTELMQYQVPTTSHCFGSLAIFVMEGKNTWDDPLWGIATSTCRFSAASRAAEQQVWNSSSQKIPGYSYQQTAPSNTCISLAAYHISKWCTWMSKSDDDDLIQSS